MLARAQCEIDGSELYAVFKQYREQVNTATQLDQLTPYFSSAFNQYYVVKLESASSKTRYLTHYWDNLNTVKDVVIVYDHNIGCASKERATLELLVVLDQPLSPPQARLQQSIADLWEVKVHYVSEGRRWLIDSFEYNKSGSEKTFKVSEIIDNFAVIR